MEEILKELIKTTLERGPQTKQFYSNLSITKPIHDQVEIQSGLCDAIAFLLARFKPGEGFQSKLYTNRNCAIELSQIHGNIYQPATVKETLTSILCLDLLCNSDDLNEGVILPEFHEIISLPEEIQDGLHDFIVPQWGITTFNLFKQSESIEAPVSPSSAPSSSHGDAREDLDSGNDSPVSMNSCQSHNSGCFILDPDNFPDDINTSALTVSVLLHQDLLQPKPAESVVRWIISNIFLPKEADASSVRFPTLINSENGNSKVYFGEFQHSRENHSDPVAVINFLKLMYTLDISHEELITAAENFLVMTLKNTIDSESISFGSTDTTRHPHSLMNALGNPSIISSDYDSEQKEETEAIQENPFSLQLQHHSPDSLLYFLSRILRTESIKSNKKCINADARPNISEMKRLLIDLLDVRLGTTVDTCDLAMRILAGVYLGLIMTPSQKQSQGHNGISTTKLLRINNLIQKEFEMLVSLQDPLEGSWPPDSIVQLEFFNGSCIISNSNNDGENDCTEFNNPTVVGYLGGKELSTLFAIKTISTYLSVKKYQSNIETDDESEDEENASNDSQYLQVHQLY